MPSRADVHREAERARGFGRVGREFDPFDVPAPVRHQLEEIPRCTAEFQHPANRDIGEAMRLGIEHGLCRRQRARLEAGLGCRVDGNSRPDIGAVIVGVIVAHALGRRPRRGSRKSAGLASHDRELPGQTMLAIMARYDKLIRPLAAERAGNRFQSQCLQSSVGYRTCR